jgi:hypothetical protein
VGKFARPTKFSAQISRQIWGAILSLLLFFGGLASLEKEAETS